MTLLTDHGEEEMRREYNTDKTINEFVAERAYLAADAGADGVIASAREVAAIRSAVPPSVSLAESDLSVCTVTVPSERIYDPPLHCDFQLSTNKALS